MGLPPGGLPPRLTLAVEHLLVCRRRVRDARSEAPAQCCVVPPTDFTIHAGRPEKSLATRQSPLVVRGSSQAN